MSLETDALVSMSKELKQQKIDNAFLRKRIEKPKIFHLTHGLSFVVTKRAKFLCFQPNDCDRAAYGMWAEHTEGRLREKISERLCTKLKQE